MPHPYSSLFSLEEEINMAPPHSRHFRSLSMPKPVEGERPIYILFTAVNTDGAILAELGATFKAKRHLDKQQIMKELEDEFYIIMESNELDLSWKYVNLDKFGGDKSQILHTLRSFREFRRNL